jgi:hypothetical protein
MVYGHFNVLLQIHTLQCIWLSVQGMCIAVMTSSVLTAFGALHDTGSVMELRTVLVELMRTQRNVSILLAVCPISLVR